MSIGKMNAFIELQEKKIINDDESFGTAVYKTLHSVRAYKEEIQDAGRRFKQWINAAAYANATDLFRFRVIPGFNVTTDYFINHKDRLFNIIAVDNESGKGLYVDVLAENIERSVS